MAREPQVGLPIAARIQVVLAKERAERTPWPEPRNCPRRKGKPAAGLLQGEVEDQILEVVQPLGVAAAELPGAASEQDRSAGRQKFLRVDIVEVRQNRRPHRVLKGSPGLRPEEAADH